MCLVGSFFFLWVRDLNMSTDFDLTILWVFSGTWTFVVMNCRSEPHTGGSGNLQFLLGGKQFVS